MISSLRPKRRLKGLLALMGMAKSSYEYAAGASGSVTVRAIMGEESLVARAAKKKRRYSSYQGEISEAPGNLLRDGRGKHRFKADAPNELWITDVTELRIPRGKDLPLPR